MHIICIAVYTISDKVTKGFFNSYSLFSFYILQRYDYFLNKKTNHYFFFNYTKAISLLLFQCLYSHLYIRQITNQIRTK